MKKKIIFIFLLIGAIGVFLSFHASLSAEKYVRRIYQSLRENDIEKALVLLDKGADKYPRRLDIRFGKISLCQLNRDILCMRQGIKSVLEQSARPGNVWLWKNDETVDVSFMLGSIQEYQKFFFDNEYDEALSDTARLILEIYPDHFESLNVLGVLALINNDCDAAKKYLDKARKSAPTDSVIKKNYSRYLKQCSTDRIRLLRNSFIAF